MTYLLSYYYYLSSLFQLVSSSTFSLGTGKTELTTIDSVSAGSDHTPHTLHSSATSRSSLSTDRVSPQRNHKSNFQHKQSMTITDPAKQIKTRADWHRWFDERRARLRTRLQLAEQAEWNWPSTRRRCEIMRIEDEIAALDAEEFVVPF